MRKFTKGLLNYFAAYSETRFQFSAKVGYKWSDDHLTADFSVFPEFQKLLLDIIKQKKHLSLVIKRGDYQIDISQVEFKRRLLEQLTGDFDVRFIKACVQQAKERLSKLNGEKVIVAGPTGVTGEAPNKKFERTAFLDGLRQFNLSFRSLVEQTLLELQQQKQTEIRAQIPTQVLPLTTFNPKIVVQDIFDSFKAVIETATDEDAFHAAIKGILSGKLFDLVMYDLYAAIRKACQFSSMGRTYLFFNEMSGMRKDGNPSDKHPIFLIEVNIDERETEVALYAESGIVLINTSAINSFPFQTVLTIPRAARLEEAADYLWGVERFLQTAYSVFSPFLLEYGFKSLVHDERPSVSYRIGLQIVVKEDRRLLDYSELITRLDAGQGGKLLDFVKTYVSGNVENTTDEVDKTYKSRYPKGSANTLLSSIPLSLNQAQRRILLALENIKNKIIVVDGPPGTGKSHSIVAITYWANQQGKSVVITSHKKAALDVIDRMLTDKFRSLHPKAKPPVLRLSDDQTGMNTFQNTLTAPVISSATMRVNNFNETAVNMDMARTSQAVEKQVSAFHTAASHYADSLPLLLRMEQLSADLSSAGILKDDAIVAASPSGTFSLDKLRGFFLDMARFPIRELSYERLIALWNGKDYVDKAMQTCLAIDKLSLQPSVILVCSVHATPALNAFGRLVEQIGGCVPKMTRIFTPGPRGHETLVFKMKCLLDKNRRIEFQSALKGLTGLEQNAVVNDISKLVGKENQALTLVDLRKGLPILRQIQEMRPEIEALSVFAESVLHPLEPVAGLYQFLKSVQPVLQIISEELIETLKIIHNSYNSLFDAAGISTKDVVTFAVACRQDGRAAKILEYIDVSYRLAACGNVSTPEPKLINEYYEAVHKNLEHTNDTRIKNLNNYSTDIERILVSLRSGKRLRMEEIKVLLTNIPCIIAEPSLISQYFPMEDDLIDIVVIDEASQVSIAESISVMLRAKQVVIFGDELQYGAVSAQNVNAQYAREYFKDILESYREEYHVTVSDEKLNKIADDVAHEPNEDEEGVSPVFYKPEEGTVDWLKTFNIRTSTLSFARALRNYNVSLDTHFRSFPEIIDYSNEFFYKKRIPLTVNRIRTKPIGEVLRFIEVKTQGNSGPNVNLDEIDTIKNDLTEIIANGFKGTIGIITSFKEQQARMQEVLRKELPNYHVLERDHKLTIWFVGDVQGEERDIVYYSFVEDKKLGSSSLRSIYPVIGGVADDILKIKMQRLNVGFSRAKDTMVFVHSMPLSEYFDTRLGEALKHYAGLKESAHDNFVSDESVFGSPAEKDLYALIVSTDFLRHNRDNIRLIAQFPIGEYIEERFHKYIPKYRVDFLLTLSAKGKERSLIVEYDGVEYHTRNPELVTAHNFSQEYIEYDIDRQLNLESYGYKFLRINKFMLLPKAPGQTKTNILNGLLEKSFAD
jgi:very-short-patch-repair endonuclease